MYNSRDIENPPVVVEHEYDSETPPSTALIKALCVCEDVAPKDAPTEFDFVLHDYVDPRTQYDTCR